MKVNIEDSAVNFFLIQNQFFDFGLFILSQVDT